MDEVEKLKKALKEVYDTAQSTPAYKPNDLHTIEYLRKEAERLENAVSAISNICESVYPLFKNAG